ncbi:MAG: hypothetical protein OXI67_10175 [Candidatus Poribacteria bacterium]|nr:hypothetical protein [Candidatus Poribacteria bacterium]
MRRSGRAKRHPTRLLYVGFSLSLLPDLQDTNYKHIVPAKCQKAYLALIWTRLLYVGFRYRFYPTYEKM